MLQISHLVEVTSTQSEKAGDKSEIQFLLEINGLSVSVIDDSPQVNCAHGRYVVINKGIVVCVFR